MIIDLPCNDAVKIWLKTEQISRSYQKAFRCSINVVNGALVSFKWDQWVQQQGNIAAEEMLKTFNCGVGFCLIINPKNFNQPNFVK
mgnify:CR=1 FL=1